MTKRKVIEDSDGDGEDDDPQSPPLPAISVFTDLNLGNVVDLQGSPAAVVSNISQLVDHSTESLGTFLLP